MIMKCLLCHSEKLEKREIAVKPQGNYWFCGECHYIFRDPGERWSLSQEQTRYERHQNDDSSGYRRFLAPVLESLLRLKPEEETWQGLDYGCGPTGFLSQLFAERGMDLLKYDPLFFPEEKVFSSQYDFVTSTEVFEHMYDPHKELDRICEVLKTGGFLLVMTSPPPDFENFKSWSYRRDETHVGFFSNQSFHFIAKQWNFTLLEEKNNLWLLQKNSR